MTATLPRNLCLVSYAVNGSGLGHLSRLVAINRWLRRYAAFAGVHTQHYFLTTSEADTLLHAEGFAGFKLPSKSVVEEAGIAKTTYLGLAKQWVWHSVALLRPDLFIVDTFPNGSFQELVGVLDLCRHKALVLRPVKDDFARRASFRTVAGLYDRIVVPEHAGAANGIAQQLGVDENRVFHTGPVMLTERFEALPRDEARKRLGVPDGAFCLLVSGGGGGDAAVDALFDAVMRAVRDHPDVHVVLAAGPLYRGAPRHGPGATFWTSSGLGPHLGGVDGAVTAAGFNTVHELMFFNVPTIFVPQEKVADDQAQRVADLVKAGAAMSATIEELPGALRQLRDGAIRKSLVEQSAARVPRNHARDAAASLLSLVLPASVVRQAAETLDDNIFKRLAACGVSHSDAIALAVALEGEPDDLDRASLELGHALALADEVRVLGAPLPVVTRIAALLARKLRMPQPGSARVAVLVRKLLEHPTLRGQGSAVLALVRLLSSERELKPEAFIAMVTSLADTAAESGTDVFGLVRVVTEVQVDGGEASNAVLVQRARARLAGGVAAT